jgi:hypothetical protein
MPSPYAPTAPYTAPRRYRKGRRRTARRWFTAVLTVIVVLIVFVIADRVSAAVAENDAAGQIQSAGFPARPQVTIEGFPFLTQVAARKFGQVDISASRVPAGPVELASLTATATGVHVSSSFKSGVIDHITGSAIISFSSLASAGAGGSGAGPGLSITAAGPEKVRIAAGPVSEDAEITYKGGNTISVRVIDNGDLLSGILGSFGSFSFTVPRLPAGMKITSVAVMQQGLRVSAAAQHTQFSQ